MSTTTPTRPVRTILGIPLAPRGRHRRTDTVVEVEVPAMLDLRQPLRVRLVEEVIRQVEVEDIDRGSALLMLDVVGLHGDRDVLAHALAAKYMRDGLLDRTIDPQEVEPGITARFPDEVLARQYDEDYQRSLVTLAQVRLIPSGLTS